MVAKGKSSKRRTRAAGRRRRSSKSGQKPPESDQRVEALLRLSSAFFWETDVQHRLTQVVRGPATVTPWPSGGQIGKTRWELPSTSPDEAGWRAHRETLDRLLPFRDFEYARLVPGVGEQFFRISGEPVFDADAAFAGYRGVGFNITALKRTQADLAQSEARFRSLTELSSDWYWEQDEQFRLTFMSSRLGEKTGIDTSAYLGRRRWEQPALNLTEADWARHRAQLERHEPFFDFEMQRESSDGRTVWLSVSGEPVFDEKGRFGGYRGVGRDITVRKRAAQLLELEHAVARCLADADSASAGLKAVMRAVCETEGWNCGRYFHLDSKAGSLRFREAWGDGDAAIGRFIAGSQTVEFRPGVGLAGQSWSSGQPLWSRDTSTDPRILLSSLSRASGMRSAFAFPVASEGKAIGVLAFSSRAIREPDERLLQAARVVGSQLGQFLQRKLAEEELRASEERFRGLTELISDWYWEQDEQFRFTLVSGGGKGSDFDPGRFLGMTPWQCPGIETGQEQWAALRADLEARRPYHDFVFWRARPDGTRSYYAVSGRPVFDSAGRFSGYRGAGRDITERMLSQERVEQLAYHDGLTGLKNRGFFLAALARAVQQARRSFRRVALVFVDLDGFKIVNDTLGHVAGDRLLQEIAGRLSANLRGGDLIARLGGDEFVVLIEDAADRQYLNVVATKLLGEIAKCCSLGGRETRVTASIGISMLPDDAADEHALMKNADIAMYRAKEKGKNTFCFFSAAPEVDSPNYASDI